MTLTVEAVYKNGQLKLKQPILLAEGTPVRVTITPLVTDDPFADIIGICHSGRKDGAANHDQYLKEKARPMIFVDTWAWIAMADDTDQYHGVVIKQHRKLLKKNRRYVTTDYVVGELIDYLYDATPEPEARGFIRGLLAKANTGVLQLVHVSPEYFQRAWQMRQKYDDKPDISFVDFTSMIVMQDLGITDVFTGDAHFKQVNLGFRLFP